MKESALILCILGFASLVVGSVLAVPSIRNRLPTVTITSTGTIAHPDESSSQAEEATLPQQASDQTNLDKIGYLTILASIGFFTAGLAINRKRN
jgi:hypothetical protein